MTELPEQVETRSPHGGENPERSRARLVALRWHIERYDRLRASTASRAGVVLSAGAILSAGNAVVLAQVFNGAFDRFAPWLVAIFTVGVLAGAVLVVLSVLGAAGVLVTSRPDAEMFPEGRKLPPSLLFNGTYTVAVARTYEQFQAAIAAQRDTDQVRAAQVELFIGIRQHRYRYQRLRDATRRLRWAAVIFLVVLALGVVINIVGRF